MSQEFETIADAIYFLTLHGLKPKKGAVDDDPNWTRETEKNKRAYERSIAGKNKSFTLEEAKRLIL